MTKVRQPRVLDESMQEVRRLAPQTLSCTVTQLHETLPTAMVTVDEADELTGRPFVEVYGIRLLKAGSAAQPKGCSACFVRFHYDISQKMEKRNQFIQTACKVTY